MRCMCHFAPKLCEVHRPTPRALQVQNFLMEERAAEERRKALAECEGFGHIYAWGSEACVRCGIHYDDPYQLPDDDIPF